MERNVVAASIWQWNDVYYSILPPTGITETLFKFFWFNYGPHDDFSFTFISLCVWQPCFTVSVECVSNSKRCLGLSQRGNLYY